MGRDLDLFYVHSEFSVLSTSDKLVYLVKNEILVVSIDSYKAGILSFEIQVLNIFLFERFKSSNFGKLFWRVKIEYNIKEIATQTKPITFVRLYVYKYRVKTLKLKTLHVYFNLNSKYTKL